MRSSAWRLRTTPATWAPVRRIFDNAGIDLRSLCYNMNVKTMADADIEYGLRHGEAPRGRR